MLICMLGLRIGAHSGVPGRRIISYWGASLILAKPYCSGVSSDRASGFKTQDFSGFGV